VKTTPARLTMVWAILSAVTIVSWWLGRTAHAGGHLVASVPVTVGILAIALFKCRLIIRQFMEVRSAPRWLKLFTDGWLLVFWGAVLALYLW
jgi:Prokaryotic Cytochrome C oxidase subunit IV